MRACFRPCNLVKSIFCPADSQNCAYDNIRFSLKKFAVSQTQCSNVFSKQRIDTHLGAYIIFPNDIKEYSPLNILTEDRSTTQRRIRQRSVMLRAKLNIITSRIRNC